MGKQLIGTEMMEGLKVGDIYYADRGYNMCSPRFYRVTKILPKMVELTGIDALHVHYRRAELKYMSNSPEYYVIPLETFTQQEHVHTLFGDMLKLRYQKDYHEYFYEAEDGRSRVARSWEGTIRSKIRSWKPSWEDKPEYYMTEPGRYGGVLTKYEIGKVCLGYCD